MVRAGCMVEIRKNNQHVLVAVIGQEGQKTWIVEDQDGTPIQVFEDQILLVLPGNSYSHEDVLKLNQHVSNSDLTLVQQQWQIIMDQPLTDQQQKTFSLPELTDKFFNKITPETLYTTYYMLQKDNLYFKLTHRIPPTYEVRNIEDLATIRKARIEEQENELILQSFIDKVLEAKQQEIGKRPSEYSQWQDWGLGNQISDLEQFALCKATPENCLKMLHSTGFEASPTGAAECLQFLGYWPAHVQLAVKRLDLDAPFSQDIQNAVKQIHENPCEDSDANIRVDFTHHRVVTIDDASTTEVDDGLSVEHLEDGRKKIWVHIADPTRFLHPHQLLDQTARDRATTIYLPTGKIPMFPLEVAEVDFSLNMQEECNALSIGVIMGEDGSLQHYEFVPSKILPTQKLTYDQTDEIIDSQDEHQHSDIFIYHKAAQLRFQYRMNMGAIQINLPECQPYADPDSDPENPEVELRVINRQLSRNLVAEMMIMAGEAAGRFGEQHQIPLPYRGQLQPVFPEGMNIHELPEGVCREAAKRTIMTRSIFSPSQPVRHASLGLNHYVQVSSPIRRYGDILTHFQIKSFLSGRPLPFSIAQVKEIMEEVNFKLREFKTKVDSECRKYWISEYFRQNKDKEYRALFCRFIRQEFGLAQALIEDLGLEVVAKVYRPVVEGEYITLRVVNVHVASGLFRLEEPWKGVVGDSMDGEASYVDADDIGLDSSYVDVVSSNDPHIY